MRRVLYLVALSLMALSLIVPSAGAQQGQTMTVMMQDNYFSPADISVPAGTTVTWVQSGNNPHTTTSYDGLWDSGILPGGSGQSFSYTFNEPGTYTYFCRPHEAQGMVGSVTVTAGGATTTAQPSMPPTGGPSLVLLAGALLLGSGILGWTILRRRSS
jgi:plastocyanin